MLYVVGGVCGVTQRGDVVYVVCDESSIIKTFSVDTLSPLRKDIHVSGMTNPRDIVVCSDGELYVADYYCIWRVSSDHSYVKWLPTESSTDRFHVDTLSVTSRGLLVTSSRDPASLREYNTTDRQLLHHVKLPGYVKDLFHGVETSRETFIICHRGTAESELQYAVSELFSCHHINDIHKHFHYISILFKFVFFFDFKITLLIYDYDMYVLDASPWRLLISSVAQLNRDII